MSMGRFEDCFEKSKAKHEGDAAMVRVSSSRAQKAPVARTRPSGAPRDVRLETFLRKFFDLGTTTPPSRRPLGSPAGDRKHCLSKRYGLTYSLRKWVPYSGASRACQSRSTSQEGGSCNAPNSSGRARRNPHTGHRNCSARKRVRST